MRLVVVDDDVVVHMTLELALDDVEVIEAFTLKDGFDLGVPAEADGFVIDRRMRGLDGLELVRRLRRDVRTNRKPIVVLTAAYDASDEVLVLQAGADAYLPKPFDPLAIESHVRAVLGIDPEQRRERRQQGIERLHSGLAPEPLIDLREPVAPDEDKGRLRGWRHRRDVIGAAANR